MSTQKILVIDDSKVIRMRVRDMLPEGDYQVLEAKDGQEGLNLIRQESPNLIMLDFLLPKVSGWEVFQELERRQDLGRVPLVIMSGRREEVTEKLQEPFELFEFIEKPFEKEDLDEAIKKAFAKARLAPATSQASTPETATVGGIDPAEFAALQAEVAELRAALAQAPVVTAGVAPEEFAALKAMVVELQFQVSQPAPTTSTIDPLEFAQLEASVAQLQMQSLADAHTVDPADFATLQGMVVEIQSQLARNSSQDHPPAELQANINSTEFQALQTLVNSLEEELHTIRHTLAQVVGFLKRKRPD
ncbi:response regulator [Synechococcus sp. PCC 6312]|uniref:response regulator n=1 Tax=Synechococcus sp. (strain ATCC 27167 / PCC 6312) TaxID=195253 RepID=UPI00029F18C5|nr:response regulator with CheY-like receiver, AAA-type ATPase, and DNA-binding domains [Synechococcus sp. PCC 6312]